MTLQLAGWIAVGLEIVLLLCWLYNVYGPNSGVDPAGEGIAQLFLIALSAYLLVSIVLMLRNTKTGTIVVLVMAGIPLILTVYGLWRYYSNR